MVFLHKPSKAFALGPGDGYPDIETLLYGKKWCLKVFLYRFYACQKVDEVLHGYTVKKRNFLGSAISIC